VRWTGPPRKSCNYEIFRVQMEALNSEVLMWCSTSVPTGGRTLEGHTTSSNSARNAFSHSGDSGGGAGGLAAATASPPQRPVDFGDGGDWLALAAQAVVSLPQRPVDSGDGGDWTALAAQAAAAETVAKDCSDTVSTRRLAAGLTNSLRLRECRPQ
jgi:hypothetical protein